VWVQVPPSALFYYLKENIANENYY